jgi:hypothetical protein
MRHLHVGIMSALSAAALGACSHAQPIDTPLTSEAVVSYRAVRDGAMPVSAADGVQFCAGDGAVQVVSKRWRSTDDWADKFRDRDVQQEVRDLLGRDPTLAGQPLKVHVHEGGAIIEGTVQRDADAVAAARDALAVPGVIVAELHTTSRESPAQPRLVATLCQ